MRSKNMKYDYTDETKNKAKKDTFWSEVGAAFTMVLVVGLAFVCFFF